MDNETKRNKKKKKTKKNNNKQTKKQQQKTKTKNKNKNKKIPRKSDAIDPARDKESQDASLPHHLFFAIIRMTLQLVHDDATNLSIQTIDSLIQNKTLFDTGHSFLVNPQTRADTLANN